MHTEIKLSQTESLLNILERELTGFSETLDSRPEKAMQRFDDLLALVRSAKTILETIN
jgi:DNA anti-recombination protein RmuC